MKKLFTFFILALSFIALAITFKIYIYESRKVSALQEIIWDFWPAKAILAI